MSGSITAPARAALLLGAILLALGNVRGEQLPLRTYTTADGLPNDEVRGVVPDSAGFLWILTRSGLSRFDGHFFTRFGPEHGLPDGAVSDLLETSEGVILVAAADGVYRLDRPAAASQSLFKKIGVESRTPAFLATVLAEGRSGAIWCGAQAGLYRLDRDGDSWSIRAIDWDIDWEVDGKIVGPEHVAPLVASIIEDRSGSLWVGLRDAGGLVRMTADGSFEHYTTRNGLPNNDLRSLLEDSEGRLWAGTSDGLCLLAPDPRPDASIVSRVYTEDEGLAGNWIPDILEDSTGRVWFATYKGLSVLLPGVRAGRSAFSSYSMANGLPDRWINTLAEDREGNLWLGTPSAGVAKLPRSGFTTYGLEDGLGEDVGINAIFENRSGSICTVTGFGALFVNCFSDRGFVSVRPNVPSRITNRGWGWNQITFQDSAGEWWVPTFEGVVRFPAVKALQDLAHVAPTRIYTTEDGLASNEVFRLYEDSRGDVWIGTAYDLVEEGNTLHRWDRDTDTIDNCNDIADVPRDTVTAFAEGPTGDLWVGFVTNGFGRLRGRSFRSFHDEDGAGTAGVEQFYFDRTGRLWIAIVNRGVIRIDDPQADRPSLTRYSTEEGLSSPYVRCITEDQHGRLYFGTLSGVTRLDPEEGHVRAYSTSDGLPSSHIVVCQRDRNGALWFGTTLGISRFVTTPEQEPAPPEVWIRSIAVAGGVHTDYELGATEVLGMELAPTQREIHVEYSALSFRIGEEPRFQYRLAGASEQWSKPTPDREIHFANLAPGRYRFEVRAVNSEGLASPEPATVSFRVLPPFWRTGWFMTLVMIGLATLAYTAHRIRLRRLIELERVRTRIATDLHDDIGSSLSQVSILTEVVRRQVRGENPEAAEPLLDQIAGTAFDLVESMSDIVWAVNPKRDRAADLVQRMRRFASDTFSGRGITLRFEAPEDGQDRRLDLDLRRQVYLIFKESVHNAVRHSRCSEAEVVFGIDGKSLTLTVADDGRGFDATRGGEGHGLESMRKRAADLGGELEIEASRGRGTTIRLHVPLGSRAGSARSRRKP